ncbi:MAG TPA: hypothetical protein VMB50_13045 [Myxococcales bacterium]|nr:hypothetical protein [Myxococcales bacterium]
MVIHKASFLSYRLFEVGDEVDLARAETLLAGGTARARPVRERSEALEIPNPPLTVPLGRRKVVAAGAEVEVELEARVFDFGVVSLLATLPCRTPAGFADLVELADDLYDSPHLLELAARETGLLMDRLAGAVRRAHRWEGHEEYTVLFIEEVSSPSGPATATELLGDQQALVRLLVGERSPLPLAQGERADVLERSFSYQERDLAAIDWNSAIVVEPSGSLDIPHLLEFATAQLLEMRYYDMLLDRELVRIYGEISRRRPGFFSLFQGRYSRLSREMTRLVVEMAEFNERVENALKIVGDFYLARVYMGAVRRFRIPDWQQALGRKQALLAQAYALLKSDLDTRRTLSLEILVALLIVLELFVVLKT